MRCNPCNIDVSENARHCPLCGSPVQTDEPLLPELSTAPYPDCEIPEHKKDIGFGFAVCCSLLTVIAAFWDVFGSRSGNYAPLIVFFSLCIWALVIRPFSKAELSLGDYITWSASCLSTLVLWCRHAFGLQSFLTVSLSVCPIFAIAALILLLRLFFLKKGHEKNIIYAIVLIASGAAALVTSLILREHRILLPSLGLLLPVLCLIFLCFRAKGKALSEIKARFHR